MPAQFSPVSAKAQAGKDFAAGKPRIFLAGGYAAFEPGIADNEHGLVAKLPRDESLTGCTNPLVQWSEGYATAYNREIIRLLEAAQAR